MVFGHVETRVENLRKQMFKIQETRRQLPHDDTLARMEKEVVREYTHALKLEESLLK